MINKSFENFDKKIDLLAKLGKPTIGFGLKVINEEILKNLRKSSSYAHIILVGPKAIETVEDFEVITDDNPEEKIVDLLVNNKVDGIIRGTIDDFKTIEAYTRLTGKTYSEDSPMIIEDILGHRFFLSPVSNPQGWNKQERLEIILGYIRFATEWGIDPRVAILTGVRHETYERKREVTEGVIGLLNKTYEEAEWIIEELKKQNLEAKNWSIDLDLAVQDGYNIIVPVNGMIGNQILRAILLSGGKTLIGTLTGIDHFIEDNSRNEKDFEFHVKWLAALINKKKSGNNG